MTIEQRPELNRLIDPSIIAPWENRWRHLRLYLIAAMPGAVLLGELCLLGGWLVGNAGLGFAAAAFSFAPPVAAILFLIIFLRVLKAILDCGKQNKNRVIKFELDSIQIGANPFKVKWEEVFKFQFEPVAVASDLTKFSLSRLNSRRNMQHVAAFVIEDSARRNQLIDYLAKRKVYGAYTFKIDVLDQPAPLFAPQPAFLSALAGAVGMIGFLNGGLILILGLNPFGEDTVERFARYRHFISFHFSSLREFHLDCLILGISLTIVGFWLMLRYKQDEKRCQALAY